jgi:hypothetical protein
MGGRNVKRTLIKTAAALALALGLGYVSSQMIEAPSGALATELQTAIQHSGFSAGAEDLAMASRHLGHVLNCIVGEGGEGFNADWGNPCGGQGAGIINDLSSHPQGADLQALVESARQLAAQGVTQQSLLAVQAAAAAVGAILQVIAGG